jgi:hypothetical protein
VVLTAVSGTITDGVGSLGTYSPNMFCSWLIQTPGATAVSVVFNRLSLGSGDTVCLQCSGSQRPR